MKEEQPVLQICRKERREVVIRNSENTPEKPRILKMNKMKSRKNVHDTSL